MKTISRCSSSNLHRNSYWKLFSKILFLECDCNLEGTIEAICDKRSGDCLCKQSYSGSKCEKCSDGFYGPPDCQS